MNISISFSGIPTCADIFLGPFLKMWTLQESWSNWPINYSLIREALENISETEKMLAIAT